MGNAVLSSKTSIGQHLTRYVEGLFLLLIWLSILGLPSYVAGVQLDESWQRSYAYFLKHRLQAGSEYVFTYGPLGYLSTRVYDRDLFWVSFIYQILVQFVLVLLLSRLIKEGIGAAYRFISLGLFLLFLGAVGHDAQKVFFLVLLGVYLFQERTSWAGRMVAIIVLCAFSLGKFISLGFGFFLMLCAEFLWRMRKPKSLFSPLPIFLICFFAFYVLLGQSIFEFPRFIYSSIETTTGYNEAMAIQGATTEIWISLALLALLLISLLQIQRQNRDRISTFQLLLLGTGLLLAWKQGFTRQDNHTIVFFGYCIFAALFLILHFEYATNRYKAIYRIASVCSLAGGIFGFYESPWSSGISNIFSVRALALNCERRIADNLTLLASPVASKNRLERQEQEMERKWAMPISAARIQREPVDIISYQQGILLLNQFNWLPRPVFQSYSAYTPYLAWRNADFFRGEHIPNFLLFKWQTTDNRYPTLDDNLALFEILSNYVPEVVERSYVLLKEESSNRGKTPVFTTFKNQIIRFNEEFPVTSRFPFQVLSLRIRPTFFGRLRKIFFRPSNILITVQTKSRNRLTYRLIPGPAEDGFLLTPLVQTTSDFVRLYGLRSTNVVQSFQLTTTDPGRWFQDEIHMELRGTDSLQPARIEREKLELIRNALQSETSFDGVQRIIMLQLEGGEPYEEETRAMYVNGTISTEQRVLAKGKYKMVLIGYGSKAAQEFPAVNLAFNGQKVGDFFLDGKPIGFAFTLDHKAPVRFSVEFHNDAMIGNEDRNAFIKSIYIVPL